MNHVCQFHDIKNLENYELQLKLYTVIYKTFYFFELGRNFESTQ